METPLMGKVAFITGAGYGKMKPAGTEEHAPNMGSAIAIRLARMGAVVVVTDIDEEAATGTSNGALTYYGYLNGFVNSGDDLKIIQGEKMGRPSAILTHIEADEDSCLIRVGGRGIMVLEGEINI